MTRLGDLQVADREPLGRRGLTFNYTSELLARACTKMSVYHRDREQYYRDEASRLEEDVRTRGVTINEQQVTGGPQFSANVDQNLSHQLAEARTRRDSHQREARIFEAWTGAFENKSTVYWLTVGDIEYFCLHGEPGE